jgi:hypothetical protein
VITRDVEERVLCYIREEPVTSMRRAAATSKVPQNTVVQILHKKIL